MWSVRSKQLDDRRMTRFIIEHDAEPVSYAEVIQLWQQDDEFCSWFISLLADSPFAAFRWETPPISATTVNRPFEFVLIDSPGLARTPDEDAFSMHFSQEPNIGVVVFPNLGKNAILVVPCPQTLSTAYGHLGAFIRQAPESQRHELWKSVGVAMEQRISSRPVWLSTAGAGVSWLHVRLDDRPKYYCFKPYQVIEKDG